MNCEFQMLHLDIMDDISYMCNCTWCCVRVCVCLCVFGCVGVSVYNTIIHKVCTRIWEYLVFCFRLNEYNYTYAHTTVCMYVCIYSHSYSCRSCVCTYIHLICTIHTEVHVYWYVHVYMCLESGKLVHIIISMGKNGSQQAVNWNSLCSTYLYVCSFFFACLTIVCMCGYVVCMYVSNAFLAIYSLLNTYTHAYIGTYMHICI